MTILCEINNGKKIWPPPVWIMRQAGRYLPEYNDVRNKAGSFLDLCYNPVYSSEVTLQPIKRFDLDAAIIFADILLVAENLNLKLHFEDNVGPIITPPMRNGFNLDRFIQVENSRLMKVMDSVNISRNLLEKEKSLIGFCGAPWTVLTYLINGRSTRDFQDIINWMHGNITLADELINVLTELSTDYLSLQIEAGADVVKIFDTWSGVLNEEDFIKWVIQPTKNIVSILKRKHNKVPIIGFPKGAKEFYEDYIDGTGVDIIALDHDLNRDFCRNTLQKKAILQGNVSPELLRSGGMQLEDEVHDTIEKFGKEPFIMNLGHGILKDTPVVNVENFIKIIREYK
jgi:uroporphyrinogen decarboxylase